jgi:hypothetical protein
MIDFPYNGLKSPNRESSTIRAMTSIMSIGFLTSCGTIERIPSPLYRGGRTSIGETLFLLGGNVSTQERAFWIASTLLLYQPCRTCCATTFEHLTYSSTAS